MCAQVAGGHATGLLLYSWLAVLLALQDKDGSMVCQLPTPD